MPKFAIYQSVRVVRLSSPKPWPGFEQTMPKIGDTGAIVEVYSEPHEAYTVESVMPDGRARWLFDFLPDDLELV